MPIISMRIYQQALAVVVRTLLSPVGQEVELMRKSRTTGRGVFAPGHEPIRKDAKVATLRLHSVLQHAISCARVFLPGSRHKLGARVDSAPNPNPEKLL